MIGDHAVVGKQPALSPRSTASREELPPLELGAGTIVSAGAIVFAGTKIGERVIVGDQACVRERCEIGDDVVIGRGTLVENDTTIGALTKIQANAYVTAYSTLEDEVFIAPGVITTNDNYMGRTEKRHELRRGPTIRRGARVGGGAVLCPGIEVGEEAFVGAGAVVVRDVPARAVVVGNPARKIREVATDELLAERTGNRFRYLSPYLPGARRRSAHHEVVPAGLRDGHADLLPGARSLRLAGEEPAVGDRGADGLRARLPEEEVRVRAGRSRAASRRSAAHRASGPCRRPDGRPSSRSWRGSAGPCGPRARRHSRPGRSPRSDPPPGAGCREHPGRSRCRAGPSRSSRRGRPCTECSPCRDSHLRPSA